MEIHILTLFPKMFVGPFDESIIKRAMDKKLINIIYHNLRDYATDSHKSVDGRAYGGGKGMIIRVDVVDSAISDIKAKHGNMKVYLTSPQGTVFTQQVAQKIAKEEKFLIIAGHYEGFDERIIEHLIDEEISIGNYVLTGGELPAMVMIDTISRLVPGVLDTTTTQNESFTDGYTFDYPHYTKPDIYNGWVVPEILKQGDHKKIETWRKEKAQEKTKKKV